MSFLGLLEIQLGDFTGLIFLPLSEACFHSTFYSSLSTDCPISPRGPRSLLVDPRTLVFFPISWVFSYLDSFDLCLNLLVWIEPEELRSNIAFMAFCGIAILDDPPALSLTTELLHKTCF